MQVEEKLSEALKNRTRYKTGCQLYSAYPRDEDFQQIKLQLRALRLIREVTKVIIVNLRRAGR
jgi:hypothetical protein